MKITENLLHNQNYIFGIKEYEEVFNFTVIKNKESDFELGAFIIPFVLFSPWIVGYTVGEFGFFGFFVLLLGIFLLFKLYKYVIISIFKNKFIIYKKVPKQFNRMKKGYWIKEYSEAKFFRENLVEKYFILIKK